MKYSSRHYAKAFYNSIKENPHNHRKVIQEFSKLLEENGDLRLADDIMDYFKKIGEEEKPDIATPKEFPEIKAGVRIRIGDTVIENTLASRLKNLKNVIAQ